MSEGFLVIDAGSGSVKTFFVSPSGVIIRSVESLWDRDNWSADKARPVILESIRELDLESCLVQGISVTSMREEFVLVKKDGKEIQYNLSPESKKHGENILTKYGEQMYDSSGHWPVPDWIAGAILPWLNEKYPAKMAGTESVLMISDWVNHILCGEACTDGTNACETAPNFLLEHVLLAATLSAIPRKYMVLSGRFMLIMWGSCGFIVLLGTLFRWFSPYCLAGDDNIALLNSDEDLEYGARHFWYQWAVTLHFKSLSTILVLL